MIKPKQYLTMTLKECTVLQVGVEVIYEKQKEQQMNPILQFKPGTDWVVERPYGVDNFGWSQVRPKDVKQYLVSADGVWEMDVEVFNAFFQLAGTVEVSE